MHSSTSSSEITKRSIVVLVALIAAVLFTTEVFSRYVVDRRSKVQALVNREHEEALRIRHAKPGSPRQLLVVGSSFVGMDLDFPLLQKQLGPGWQVHRYWLYNTFYNDWYFGLKRLLTEGSRPDAIAITFATTSWYISEIRGDYSSYYLFQTSDLPALAAAANLNNTEASGLLFARYSRFYGLRSEIRKVLLQTVIPDLPRMYDLMHPGAGKPLTSAEVSSVIAPRIEKMQRLAERYGIPLVLIVPPIPRPGQEFHPEILAAARAIGVDVVMPFSCADLPAKLFADDVHLSPEGATLYTGAIARPLGSVLENVSARNAQSDTPEVVSNLHGDHPQTPVIGRPVAVAVQAAP